MDYANERYARVYTRDTTTWKVLDWQARTVLLHMIRKAERVGSIEVGHRGVRGLAAILELPIEIVAAAIPQLVEEMVIVETDTAFVMPNYLAAQEAVQTTGHRSREYRERLRAAALGVTPTPDTVTKRDASITKRDANDTDRHASSQTVTPNLTVPNQERGDVASPPAREAAGKADRRKPKAQLPADWSPVRSEAVLRAEKRAADRGVDVAHELEQLRNWSLATAAVGADWDARWRMWLGNAKKSSTAPAKQIRIAERPDSYYDPTPEMLAPLGHRGVP